MSVINIISNEEITLVQGVGGLFLCEESWIAQSVGNARLKKVLDKKSVITKNEGNNSTECSRTEL
ncbi:hypothetical protein [Bacteroides heparinolyticus]|uniref:hypothetical protein n=1 Tax=Prevotella heparinolytica TaxID=28113 RepID=UPI0035A0E3CC